MRSHDELRAVNAQLTAKLEELQRSQGEMMLPSLVNASEPHDLS